MATDTVAEGGGSIDVSVVLSTGAGAFEIGSLTVNLNVAGVTASTYETWHCILCVHGFADFTAI